MTTLKNYFVLFLFLSFAAGCSKGSDSFQKILSTPDTGGDTGTIGDSALSFSPAAWNFGNISILETSSNKVIQVINSKSLPVYITNISVATSDFLLVSDDCPRSPTAFSPGSTCNITTNFTPAGGGSQSLPALVTYSADTSSSSTFSSLLSLSGRGISPLVFAGISGFNPVTTRRITINWPATPDATSFQIYMRISGVWNLIKTVTNPTGALTSGTVQTSDLPTPNVIDPATTYTFRVRAVDVFGSPESNTNDQSVTTDPVGSFTASGLITTEGTLGSLNLSVLCADGEANTPTSFTLLSQTSSNANPGCAIVGSLLSCTPAYIASHASWSESVSVRCLLNDSELTQTLSVTVNDTNRPPMLSSLTGSAQAVTAGSAITAVQAEDSNTGNDTDIDGDTITYTCNFIGGAFSTSTPCASLPAIGFSFVAGTGVLNWTPSYSATPGSISTTYLISLTGSDGTLTDTESFNIFVNPGPPLLDHTPSGDRIYLNAPTGATGPVYSTTALSVDFNNMRTGSATDAGVTYTCVFDTVVDASVSSGSNCILLPGGASFSSVGVLAWTPPSGTYGNYEIRVTGTNSAGSNSQIFIVNVPEAFSTTNLVSAYDPMFAATTGGQGLNSLSTSSLADLFRIAGNAAGTLNNFGLTTSSGWAGNGTSPQSSAANGPYRLVFDGTNDNVSLGTTLNGYSSFFFDTWIRPTTATAAKKVIASHSGSQGFFLEQSPAGDTSLVLRAGEVNPATLVGTTVAGDTPEIYFKLDETSGTTIVNTGSLGAVKNGTINNSANVTLGLPGPLSTGTTAMRIAANGHLSIGGGGYAVSPSYTLTAWFKTPLQGACVNGGSWCNLFRGSSRYYVMINNAGVIGAHNNSVFIPALNSGVSTDVRTLADGWHHLAVVGAGSDTSFYLNGNFIGTTGVKFTEAILTIGNINNTFSFGTIAEVAMYPSALTQTQIQGIASAAGCRSFGLADNEWYHVAGKFNDSTKQMSLWVNGVQSCTSYYTGSASRDNSANLSLGDLPSGTASWSGQMSAFRFYSDGGSAEVATNLAASQYRHETIPKENLRFWLKADNISGVAGGGQISEWRDSSGQGNHVLQATAGNRPTYVASGLNSKPAVNFARASSQFLQSNTGAFNPGPNYTAFAVFRAASYANWNTIFEMGTTTNCATFGMRMGNGGVPGVLGHRVSCATFPQATGFAAGANQGYLMTIRFNGSAQTLWMNSGAVNVNNQSTTAVQTGVSVSNNNILRVGATPALGADYFNGEIYEIIVYNTNLSDTQKNLVESYLRTKYGL